jgi:flagellar basal-body rod protein FlgB
MLHSGNGNIMPVGMFDSISAGLARALTVHHRRHEVLAANLANVETPGYRAHDVDFEQALEGAFTKQNPDAFAPRVVDRPSGVGRADGNTVDIDMEMARLADNRGRFTTYAEILARRFATLRRAIEGA